MQTNPGNMFVPDAQPLPAAAVSLRLVTADAYIPTDAFLVPVRDLFAKLNTHEFLVTLLTGSNNDVAVLARLAGDQNVALELRDPAANSAALDVSVHSFLTTLMTGANNDVTLTAVPEGATLGNAISLTLVDPAANNASLIITVTGSDISASLATGSGGAITTTGAQLATALNADAAAKLLVLAASAVGNSGATAVTALSKTNLSGSSIVVKLATGSGGAITSTAAQLVAAILADVDATALVFAQFAPSNDGTGIVTALGTTPLAGPTGTSPTLDVTLKHDIDTTTLPLATTHSAFAQKTTATSEFKTFATVAPVGQWLFDVGGTTPVFAASINVVYRPTL